MQEVLSRTTDPNAPAADCEFYELRLDDSDNVWMGRHVIRETHALWDASTSQIAWAEPEIEYVPNIDLADERYEARRAALVKRGFLYSDMDW